MSNLQLLLDAYVRLIESWPSSEPGNNSSRHWASTRFLERLIKQELKKLDNV